MFIIIYFLIFILVIYLNSRIKTIDYLEEYNAYYMSPMKYPTIKRKSKLELYFDDIKHYHPLSHEEETKLANDIQNGNQKALETLTKSQLQNIISLMKENNLPLKQEFINKANIMLVEKAKSYNGEKSFSQFVEEEFLKSFRLFLS